MSGTLQNYTQEIMGEYENVHVPPPLAADYTGDAPYTVTEASDASGILMRFSRIVCGESGDCAKLGVRR